MAYQMPGSGWRKTRWELTWDKLLGQYYGETVSGSGQQYIWMEEEDSMKLKIDLIKEFDLAGVACWKLGI